MSKSKRDSGKNSSDFIFTLESDSESEVPEPSVSDKRLSKGKLSTQGDNYDDEFEEINPNFEFAVDDYGAEKGFQGWDFEIENDGKSDTSDAKKNVDLDEIIRRKGGLTNIIQPNDKEDESSAAEDGDASADSDDDELAMDGFGANAEEAENHTQLDSEEAENQLSGDENDEEDDNKNEDSDIEDTPEEMANFYASESAEVKQQAHETFQSLQLSRPILRALGQLGYVRPSAIQSSAIPIALLGKDIVAGAVTGSGKTAAYMIPIIERLLYKPSKISAIRVVVLTPTRELAIQVHDVGKKIGRFVNNLNFGLAVGGLNLRQQEQQLKSRPDIVIATPGRLIDHIRNSPSFSIDTLEIMVIDEADRMLDEGFQAELTEILHLIPKQKRQTLLFSATMNTKIQDLIQLSLDRPVRIMIDPPKATTAKLVQEFVRIRKRDHLKPALLFELLNTIDSSNQHRVVVFVSTKGTAHRLRVLLGVLGLKVSELHGALSQEQRLKNVTDFKELNVSVLICTDLAARGLDIPKIEFVINYDMPKTHEIYLHRVGRTARAGREGRSITLVGESSHDRSIVKDALKSVENEPKNGSKRGKIVSRNIDWPRVEDINKIIDNKEHTIQEILEEEKEAKEMLQAEMELNKADNLIKHRKEIMARPKRTWFESSKDDQSNIAMKHLTKNGSKLNSKKRKALEVKKSGITRSFKKTKQDKINNKSRSKSKSKKSKK